jgi:alanyl-tRNA synthetase
MIIEWSYENMSADQMKKYWEDSYVFSFDAEIKEAASRDGRLEIILKETYFYPEGGGQPSDKGTIGQYPVLDVQEVGDAIIHYMADTSDAREALAEGSRVHCEIDMPYRIHNMRLHTGSHLLFGAARRLFPEVKYAGFNIGEVGNLYLETPRQIRANDLHEMSLIANQYIVEDHIVKDYFIEKDQVNAIEGFAMNMDEVPEGRLRVIEVDGWDVAACSGTHMKRTLEIGPIKVLAREIHKKNVTRIDFAIGVRAVEEIHHEEKVLGDCAEFLSTSKDSLFQIVQKNQASLQACQKDLRKLREKLLAYQFDELKSGGTVTDGIRLIIDVNELLDAGACKVLATKLLAESQSTVAAIISGGEETAVAAGCSSDLDLDVSSVIIPIAREYSGGGGGKPTFVTAGGIKADVKTIRNSIEKALAALIADRN